MSAWKVDIGGGRELVATHVPGRTNAYLGVQEGSTFVAMARFISDADMEAMFKALQGVAFVPVSGMGES